MVQAKHEALRLIQALPEDCTFEDIQYHLYIREAFEEGMRDVDAGRVLDQQEVENRVRSWFNSSGPSGR